MEENTKIKEAEAEAEKLLADIKVKIDSAASLIGEIQTSVTEAKTKVDQIITKDSSAETKLKEIESRQNAIAAIEGSVSTLLQQVQSKANDAESMDKRLSELKQKMEDPTAGVEATLQSISEKQKIAEENAVLTETSLKEIKVLNESATALEGEVQAYKVQVDGYKKHIEEMYGYITGAGLSHSFTERQKELEWGVSFWKYATLVSVAILGGILFYIYKNPLAISGPWYELFLYKVTYSSPGIFLIWFTALQYSRSQRLMDSYAFKAATAKALENYTEVLERRFSDPTYKKEILDFVLSSMKSIYQHPNSDLVAKEDAQIEENILAHVGSVLNEVNTKVIEPVSSFMDKAKSLVK